MEVADVEREAVMVVVSFLFKPSSLFSFDLHFVAFSSSSCRGESGAGVEVLVVVADVVLVALVVCSFVEMADILDPFRLLSLSITDRLLGWLYGRDDLVRHTKKFLPKSL